MADHAGRIGVISDTHGLLRPEAVLALEGCGLIIHAGDVGRPEILDRLGLIAPVVAVRGNIDHGSWAEQLPETTVVESGCGRIYVIHDLNQLAVDPAVGGYTMVISGHSHQATKFEKNGVTYLNPGSAGPRRFRLPVTIALLNRRGKRLDVEIIPLLVS